MVWLAGLAAVTLVPAGGPVARIVSVCLLCGDRPVADALLNVVLFVPFGLLTGTRRGPIFALAAGVTLAACVEVGQLLLAGRYSNVGDIFWNGLGAWLGSASAPVLRRWLVLDPPPRARLVAVALPTTWLIVAGIVLHPVPVASGFGFGATAASTFAGSAGGGGQHRPVGFEGVAADVTGAEARMDLAANGDWMLTAETVRRAPPRGSGPIVVVHDAQERPIRMLGADRGDLVLWQKTRADAAGFDQANHRLASALAG